MIRLASFLWSFAFAAHAMAAGPAAPVPLADPPPADSDAPVTRRPMADWFPASVPSCHIGQFEPAEAMAASGRKLQSLVLARGPDQIAAEQRHDANDLIPSIRLQVRATLLAPKARTLEVDAHCEADGSGLLRCVSLGCFRGLMTVTPDGPDAVVVSVGGQIGSTFVADFFDLSTQCPAGATPVALESGDRPLALRLTRAGEDQCR